jgi:ABC-2 type transport system ATP-binding protein
MICDRVIIVSRGKVVADSPTAELRARYGSRAQLKLQLGGCGFDEFAKAVRELTDIAGCAAEEGEEGLTSVVLSVGSEKDVRPSVFALVKSRGWILYEMSLRHNSLEDVFRSLTVGGNEE